MTQFAVVAFPELSAPDAIKAVRDRYDPLAGMLAAHVTLVFPFEDTIEESTLRHHVERSIAGIRPFEVALPRLSAEPDGYVFLDIGRGAASCIALHDRLYTGPMARHLSSAHSYRPHVTVGRLADAALAAVARDEIERQLELPVQAAVGSVSLFRLLSVGRGVVAFTVPLPT